MISCALIRTHDAEKILIYNERSYMRMQLQARCCLLRHARINEIIPKHRILNQVDRDVGTANLADFFQLDIKYLSIRHRFKTIFKFIIIFFTIKITTCRKNILWIGAKRDLLNNSYCMQLFIADKVFEPSHFVQRDVFKTGEYYFDWPYWNFEQIFGV